MNTYTIKPSSTEDFYNTFTLHAIKISGEPSYYDNIRQLRSTVYDNAASVNASQGGGLHGHLGMVMDAATYATIAAVEWTDPVEPPPIPNIPTTQELLGLLINTYGFILPQELEAKRNKLALPHDATSEPFQVILERFEEARSYPMYGNDPIMDAQLINSGIVVFKNTGVLDRVIDLWTDKPAED